MPFKSVKKRRAYAQKWRRTHPAYMRDYGRYYRSVIDPKKDLAELGMKPETVKRILAASESQKRQQARERQREVVS